MADVRRVMALRHLRGAPTVHVRHLRRGRVVHDGVGLSFWYRPLAAVISEVPVNDRELPLLFHARTSDFQDVAVQATVTFRVADPALAAARVDFSIDPDSGRWRATPLEQLAGLLTELAQQHVMALLARTPLREALVEGVAAVRDHIAAGLADDPRLAETGVHVLGARVVAVRPQPDVEKALQTPTREQVQQEADRATYQRRALAVERERAIAENELQNRIELARREEQLVAQRGRNDRRTAEETAAAERIQTTGKAERDRLLAAARADGVRLVGAAEAEAEAAKLAAYRDLDGAVLLGLAAREAARNLPSIDSLTLTPDLLAPVLARLARADGGGR